LAQKSIETALHPFYDVGWADKYTLIVVGPSSIISANLRIKKDVNSLYDETEEVSPSEEDEGGEN